MREQKYSHLRKQFTDSQGERKRVDEGLKWKVSTVDIRIKKSGLKFIHSKVPSSELWILESALSVNGNIYFYWNYSVRVWPTISLGLNPKVEPNILQLSITWHKMSSELRLKVGLKELRARLKPKFLNCGLRQDSCIFSG